MSAWQTSTWKVVPRSLKLQRGAALHVSEQPKHWQAPARRMGSLHTSLLSSSGTPFGRCVSSLKTKHALTACLNSPPPSPLSHRNEDFCSQQTWTWAFPAAARVTARTTSLTRQTLKPAGPSALCSHSRPARHTQKHELISEGCAEWGSQSPHGHTLRMPRLERWRVGRGRVPLRLCMREALYLMVVVVVMQMVCVTSHTSVHVEGLVSWSWCRTVERRVLALGVRVRHGTFRTASAASLQNKNPKPTLCCLPDTHPEGRDTRTSEEEDRGELCTHPKELLWLDKKKWTLSGLFTREMMVKSVSWLSNWVVSMGSFRNIWNEDCQDGKEKHYSGNRAQQTMAL